MGWVVVAAFALAVYAAIFVAIRANVRRLVAMRPEERERAVRRQLIATTITAFAMLVVSVILLSND